MKTRGQGESTCAALPSKDGPPSEASEQGAWGRAATPDSNRLCTTYNTEPIKASAESGLSPAMNGPPLVATCCSISATAAAE